MHPSELTKNSNMSECRVGALATPKGCCDRPVPDVRIAGRPTRGVSRVGFHGETNDFFFFWLLFVALLSFFFLGGLGYTLGFRGRVQGPLGDKPAEEAGCRGEMQKGNMVTALDRAVWPKGPKDQRRRCQLCHGSAPIDESRPCSSGTAIGT